MAVEVIAKRSTAARTAAQPGLPPMRFSARIERLRERLGGEHAGAVLVTNLSNVHYLCGFSGSAGMLILTPTRLYFLTDSRYQDQSAQQMSAAGVEAEIVVRRAKDQLAEVAKLTHNITRLAVEADALSWSYQRKLAEATRAELVPTSGLVEVLRVKKDGGEIARIERACDIADIAFAQTKERLAEAPTEREFAAELEFEMHRRGADGSAFETIVASGPNAALPHARPTDRQVEPGELVVVDFGAMCDGYRSDMTRTVCVGDPTGEAAAVLEAVAASQRAGLLAVSAGASGHEVDAACRKSLDEAGFGAFFTHSTGHGVGIDIHERPSIGNESADILLEGTVVTVEPGAYLPDKTGARIEDTVLVTASGYRALTKTTKDATI